MHRPGVVTDNHVADRPGVAFYELRLCLAVAEADLKVLAFGLGLSFDLGFLSKVKSISGSLMTSTGKTRVRSSSFVSLPRTLPLVGETTHIHHSEELFVSPL